MNTKSETGHVLHKLNILIPEGQKKLKERWNNWSRQIYRKKKKKANADCIYTNNKKLIILVDHKEW